MAFEYNPDESNEIVTSFTWIPGTMTREVGEDDLAVLNRLISHIPAGTGYPISDEGLKDYPRIRSELMEGSQVHYSMRRPVFSIAGIPFFRRYNDTHNALVMRGKCKCKEDLVEWLSGGVSRASITRLLSIVETCGISNVTESQVLEALRN